MTRRRLLLAACTIAGGFAFPAAASAGVTVIGAGNARMCYLAAEAKTTPRIEEFRRCDDAVSEQRGDARTLSATHVNRGILRLRVGNMAGALADFDAATALNPNEPEAYLNRASTLLRQDQVSGAISEFDAAIAKRTRRPALAYYGRGIAHEQAGNVRAAYKDYLTASQLAPSWGEPRRELTRFRVVRN